MAKIVSPVWAQISGSIAGTTYYNAAGGIVARSRVTPTNPNSTAQQRARTDLADAAEGWGDLSAADRGLWTDYAASTPKGSLELTGQQMFNRWASARGLVGEAITGGPLAGVTGFGQGCTVIALGSLLQQATVTIGGGGASEDGDLYVRMSLAVGANQNSVKRPLAFNGAIAVGMDDVSGVVALTPGVIVTGGRYVCAARIAYDDGRLSPLYTELVTAVA